MSSEDWLDNDEVAKGSWERAMRSTTVLWFAMFGSVGVLFALAYVLPPETAGEAARPFADSVVYVMGAVAMAEMFLAVGMARLWIPRAIARAEKSRNAIPPKAFQTFTIFSLALCESIAVMGLIVYRTTQLWSFALPFFVMAAFALVLCFPRRPPAAG